MCRLWAEGRGGALESAYCLTTVVLDKTGTLTRGEPRLTDVIPANGISQHDLLRLAASAERGSEHPLGEAIVAGSGHLGLVEPVRFDAPTGRGVVATVAISRKADRRRRKPPAGL